MKLISLACLIVAAAFTAGAAPFRTDINPALQYYQAFIVAPDFSPPDHDYLFTNEWSGQKLPERFGALVAHYDNQFKLVRQAAEASVPCDWGIDMSPGPGTLLGHLARARAISQAVRFRALWDLQQGRQASARDELLAVFALARNSSRGGILISALVQFAMENIVSSIVAENFYQFSPETLKQLADGFEAAPARGAVAGCIPAEKASFSDWLANQVVEWQKKNPGNDAKVMAAIHELLGGFVAGGEEGQTQQDSANLWEQITKAAGGTSEGVLKLLRELDPLYQRLATILALPHPEYEAQTKPFSADIQNSTNPFVGLMFPSWDKCRQKEFAILVEVAMVRAAVEYKFHGEAGLKSVMDPCGQGPFALQRFVFEGVDRGFELKSAYDGRGFPEVLIFAEKEGIPFHVNGKNAGQALSKSSASK